MASNDVRSIYVTHMVHGKVDLDGNSMTIHIAVEDNNTYRPLPCDAKHEEAVKIVE